MSLLLSLAVAVAAVAMAAAALDNSQNNNLFICNLTTYGARNHIQYTIYTHTQSEKPETTRTKEETKKKLFLLLYYFSFNRIVSSLVVSICMRQCCCGLMNFVWFSSFIIRVQKHTTKNHSALSSTGTTKSNVFSYFFFSKKKIKKSVGNSIIEKMCSTKPNKIWINK